MGCGALTIVPTGANDRGMLGALLMATGAGPGRPWKVAASAAGFIIDGLLACLVARPIMRGVISQAGAMSPTIPALRFGVVSRNTMEEAEG